MERYSSQWESHYASQSSISDDGDYIITSQDEGIYRCYEVLYGKLSSRMHKRWQGDGLLYCRERSVILQTERGKEIAKASSYSIKQLTELKKGSRLKINNYEVEVQAELNPRQPAINEAENVENQAAPAEPIQSTALDGGNSKKRQKITNQNFISPLFGRDNPLDFVLDETKDDDGSIRRIAVDAQIASCLKPHQKSGIAFIYKCLKGSHGGAILADEMGLGKTVQTISLIMALIKKRLNQKPIIRRCVIVVPTSLLNNWYAEFIKWSPQTQSMLFRILKSTDVEKLISYRNTPIIAIVSYDMIARTAAELSAVSIDLLVCDEAHRLKNLNGRLREQLQNLHAQRRLLLTGTPMQNDLEEFYSLVSFARPDLFTAFSEFKHLCEVEPILFNGLLAEVMLRRTAEVIHDCLPPKIDYIIWCQPSPLQCFVYKRLKTFLSYDHLTLIDVLRKLCNHPCLLYRSIVVKLQSCKMEEKEFYNSLLGLFPSTFNDTSLSVGDSGKLSVFCELVTAFRTQEENVVVVSNFTHTLDLLEDLCRGLFYTVLRLDGSTDAKKRMEIVEEFNSSSTKSCAFLLSAKAGGLGLNLIGASRMVLFDLDWNPAVDIQAMARIWRQGQKKPCQIYRLITGGTVDEKILQRQIKKSSLNTIVEMVPPESFTHFSDEELQDIFTLHDDTECETHCLLECQCDGCGRLPEELEENQDNRPDENSESVTTYSERMDGNNDLVPESSANLLIQDYSNSTCFNNNEVLEAENKIVGDEAALSASALMGTLMRWQHYSPRYENQFESVKTEADLDGWELEEVSFIMKLVSNF
ncbi:SNF2 N-terminal domain family protein [Acanthocheilonema viteae]